MITPKEVQRIDSLASSAKVLPWLCVIGIAIPIVLLIGAVIGLLHWFWRGALLKRIGREVIEDPILQEKVSRIERAKLAYLSPAIILVIYILIIAGMIAFAGPK